MGLQPQALRLQRQGSATREGIVEGRQLVRVEQLTGARMPGIVRTGAAPALAHLRSRLFEKLLVGRVLPADQFLDKAEQPLPLLRLVRLGGELLRAGRGIVHHLREDHRPRRGQGTPRPPEMQGARVPVADRLLPRRRRVDGVEGQGDLDELLAVEGHGESGRARQCEASANSCAWRFLFFPIFGRWRDSEPVDRYIGYPWSLQEYLMRGPGALRAFRMPAREYPPPELLLRRNLPWSPPGAWSLPGSSSASEGTGKPSSRAPSGAFLRS